MRRSIKVSSSRSYIYIWTTAPSHSFSGLLRFLLSVIELQPPERRYEDALTTTNADVEEAMVRLALPEEYEISQQSSEAVHLLAESLRILETATSLHCIELCSNGGRSSVLEAMRLALFSRKVAYILAVPRHFTNCEYGSFSIRPEDPTSYVEGLQMLLVPWADCGETVPPS